MDINGIQNQINRLNDRVNLLNALVTVLQRAPRSLHEEIFQKYIELESTTKVAKYIRDKDIRTQRNTSFHPNDISDIIKNEYQDVDPALVIIAHEIFNKNTKAVAQKYW